MCSLITLDKMNDTQRDNHPQEQYISPEVCVFEIEVEKGFLNSNSIGNQVPGVDDNNTPSIESSTSYRSSFPDHSF